MRAQTPRARDSRRSRHASVGPVATSRVATNRVAMKAGGTMHDATRHARIARAKARPSGPRTHHAHRPSRNRNPHRGRLPMRSSRRRPHCRLRSPRPLLPRWTRRRSLLPVNPPTRHRRPKAKHPARNVRVAAVAVAVVAVARAERKGPTKRVHRTIRSTTSTTKMAAATTAPRVQRARCRPLSPVRRHRSPHARPTSPIPSWRRWPAHHRQRRRLHQSARCRLPLLHRPIRLRHRLQR